MPNVVPASTSGNGGKSGNHVEPSLTEASEALEQRAKRLLNRGCYDEAAKIYKELIQSLQLQRASSKNDRRDASLIQEIVAQEGLALCLSRLLDEAKAEDAQRQALALRCEEWDSASTHGDESCGRMHALKRAALPCLLNLGSIVSNQGRYMDAEVILRTILRILAQRWTYIRRSGVPFHPSETASSANGNPVIVPEESVDPPEESAVENDDRAAPVSPAPPPMAGLGISGWSGVGCGLPQENSPPVSMVGVDGDQEDVVMEEGASESDLEMAAMTKHRLALVVHAQGRVQEAEHLLEESVDTFKRGRLPQAVMVSQTLHDLAGIVHPRDPARACTLYREALAILEDTMGVDHFLTAPTLARLGSLLGDSIVAAADIPLTPAAPAGPGAAGIARSVGLAEAVCAPGESLGVLCSSAAASIKAAAGPYWDVNKAEGMIKRAIKIQARELGWRDRAVASSLRYAAELYRKQGRLSEAESLFRKAISIWEASSGPIDADAVAALHGMAHCVLAGAGADWLGRFEEAFSLVDQAYRIASTLPGSDVDSNRSCPRLLLEALRMIRSRQRQGRGEPQPASAAIMEAVWNGRWDPSKTLSGSEGDDEMSGDGLSTDDNNRNHSRGDDPRCAVCLEEIGVGGNDSSPGLHEDSMAICDGRDENGITVEVKPDIGSEEAVREQTEDARSRGRVAYLPCGHRFHSHCIGRWLVHSSSCPSCRSRVHDDAPSASSPRSRSATSRTASSADSSPQLGRGTAEVGDVVNSSPLDNASRSRVNDGVDDRPLSPIRGEDGPAPFC